MSDTDFLIEIGAICSSFEGLLQGHNRKLIQNIKELCDKARLQITKRNDEIERLQRENADLIDDNSRLIIEFDEEINAKDQQIARLEAMLDRLADPLYMCSEQEYIDDDTEAEIKARIEYAASHRGKEGISALSLVLPEDVQRLITAAYTAYKDETQATGQLYFDLANTLGRISYIRQQQAKEIERLAGDSIQLNICNIEYGDLHDSYEAQKQRIKDQDKEIERLARESALHQEQVEILKAENLEQAQRIEKQEKEIAELRRACMQDREKIGELENTPRELANYELAAKNANLKAQIAEYEKALTYAASGECENPIQYCFEELERIRGMK